MPKETTPQAAPAPAPELDEQLSLDEYCQRRSRTDRRVELLAAFHSNQSRSQQFKATEAEFTAALDKFANQPV